MDILNRLIDSMQDDLIKSVQKLVQIKSVKGEKQLSCPFGEGSAKALTEALRIGQNLGFKTKNINNYVGYAVVEHQPNEYIEIKDLILDTKIYAHAICELSREDWNL